MSRLIDADPLIEALGERPLIWTGSPEEFQAKDDWERFVNLILACPTIDAVDVQAIYDAGYSGDEVRFRIGGRLFAIRELPQ